MIIQYFLKIYNNNIPFDFYVHVKIQWRVFFDISAPAEILKIPLYTILPFHAPSDSITNNLSLKKKLYLQWRLPHQASSIQTFFFLLLHQNPNPNLCSLLSFTVRLSLWLEFISLRYCFLNFVVHIFNFVYYAIITLRIISI
jgi:hypothetical protein